VLPSFRPFLPSPFICQGNPQTPPASESSHLPSHRRLMFRTLLSHISSYYYSPPHSHSQYQSSFAQHNHNHSHSHRHGYQLQVCSYPSQPRSGSVTFPSLSPSTTKAITPVVERGHMPVSITPSLSDPSVRRARRRRQRQRRHGHKRVARVREAVSTSVDDWSTWNNQAQKEAGRVMDNGSSPNHSVLVGSDRRGSGGTPYFFILAQWLLHANY
jgi:hypothetical protein